MSIKINIKKNISTKLVKNYVFFTNEDFKINGLKDLNLGKDVDLIKSSIKSFKLNKKNFLYFNIRPDLKVILVKVINSKNSIDN